MNPKPLLALNHFTVPCSLTDVLPSFISYLCFSTAPSRKTRKGRKFELAAPSIESKGVTRATNATQTYHAFVRYPNEFLLGDLRGRFANLIAALLIYCTDT